MKANTPSSQPHIKDLKSYQFGLSVDELALKHGLKPTDIIQLSLNESSFGMSPKAHQALIESVNQTNRYIDALALRRAIAKHWKISADNVLVGSGSNEILDLIARAFLTAGSQAISSEHAFSIYRMVGQAVGAENIIVPATNYGHDLKVFAKAIKPKTKVIWIANPNNPTGTFVPYKEIEAFLALVPKNILVVLDEAYYEYLAPNERLDIIEWLAKFPNLVITRTFSKAYGLAGLRVGYAIADAKVIELLNRIRQPFNVSSVSLATALAAFNDQAYVEKISSLNLENRQLLQSGLTKLGLKQIPSRTNFVSFKIANAQKVAEELLKRGIIVRWLGGDDLPDHIRVTVGSAKEIEFFLKKLERLLPGTDIPVE